MNVTLEKSNLVVRIPYLNRELGKSLLDGSFEAHTLPSEGFLTKEQSISRFLDSSKFWIDLRRTEEHNGFDAYVFKL